MADTERFDFFISYAGVDEQWATWIAEQLEDQFDKRVTLKAWHFRPGEDFVADMDTALQTSDRVIPIISAAYLERRFTRAEWQAAFARGENQLLPIRIEDIDIKGLLSSTVFVDFVGCDGADACLGELVKALAPKGRTYDTAFPGPPSVRPAASAFPGRARARYLRPPPARGEWFEGRADTLERLWSQLHEHREAEIVPLAGMAGVGKTALAAEFCRRFADRFETITWIDAERPDEIAGQYATIAQLLTGSDTPPPADDAIRLVRGYFAERDSWLVVFDNAGERTALQPYLPFGPGCILATTRDGRFGTKPTLRFTIDTLPIDVTTQWVVDATSGDAADAGELAIELDGLPLAVNQAISVINETGWSVATYLDAFRARRDRYLGEGQPADYPATVATTWSLAFDRLGAPARAALDRAACLDPRQVPARWVTTGLDELDAGRAIGELARHGLITDRADGHFDIHRLVQHITRDRADFDQQLTLDRLIEAISDDAPDPEEPTSTDWWSNADPHVAVLADHIPEPAGLTESFAELLDAFGRAAVNSHDPSRAVFWLDRAVAAKQSLYGPDHASLAASLTNLGISHRVNGDNQRAIELSKPKIRRIFSKAETTTTKLTMP